METVVLQVVSGVIGLIVLWLREYSERDKTYENARELRDDVVSGNVDAITVRIDRLLVEQDNNPARVQSDADTTKRLGDILGKSVVSK